jgi:hypothetical protein
MSDEKTITLNVNITVTLTHDLLEKIADSMSWVNDVFGCETESENASSDEESQITTFKTAQQHADAMRNRQALRKASRDERRQDPVKTDFSKFFGSCEKITDDIVLQSRLNSDNLWLRMTGEDFPEDVEAYRRAVRNYSKTLDEIVSRTKKPH